MEDQNHPFDRILVSPGLFWIGEYIINDLLVDDKCFVNCELVCKTWRNFFVQSELWKKRLLKHIAPEGSHRRYVLQKHLKDFEDLIESHNHYRKVAFSFSRKAIEKSWENEQFSIKRIVSFPIVRDIQVMNGSQVIVAEKNTVTIANRNEFIVENSILNIAKFNIKSVLKSHRREVTCLDFDAKSKIAISGGRDRNLITWDTSNGTKLNTQNEAHARLITKVKIHKDSIFSSSRDRSIKIWDLFSLTLVQTLIGDHAHSVWCIDISHSYLVSASADDSLGVWHQNDQDSWKLKHKLNNEEPVRNVIILKKSPELAVSGDLLGDLKVWNIHEGQFKYQVPHPTDSGLFRQGGVIVSLTQTEDLVGVAFSIQSVALFSTKNCQTALEPLKLFELDTYLEKTAFIRTITLTEDGQLYVCNVSGQNGIVLFDILQ